MSLILDQPHAPREGEELDLASIEPFLKDSIPGLNGPIEISQFPSGHSNLTYSIKAGDRDLVLRRPPFGAKAKSAHDMGREYRVMSALHGKFPYCPKPLAYTEDASIIGSQFYVMERIKGTIIRKDVPEGLDLGPEKARALCLEMMDVLAQLHTLAIKEVGLENFGKPKGYTQRQVQGWTRRYHNAKTPDTPDCEPIIEWLEANMPPEPDRASVLHGDFKMDNVILDPNDPTKIIGVLDWEMSTTGNPLMDLANPVSYWAQADDDQDFIDIRMMPTHIPGALNRKELIERYVEKTGFDIPDFTFYMCFGVFRLIVIDQQIYYRFYHGQTKDERFAEFIHRVHVLTKKANAIIQGGMSL
ncbi:aminoglycoside phosphotransferase [Desulfatibacillum aliphaticivorans]|uniref:Aminoglycoside phosphotransferase n=1 Tax=Desulfatibacillum aliphaticivorans TaxID=218208 RepID=B8FFA1_DESAL|nr:phosphotransferase family protein [Desulfatibacillum aliphaticivorans]ACL04161.1 aminoglycoside phosphotransferase [Desulfatibacillum aliphaticivorans]